MDNNATNDNPLLASDTDGDVPELETYITGDANYTKCCCNCDCRHKNGWKTLAPRKVRILCMSNGHVESYQCCSHFASCLLSGTTCQNSKNKRKCEEMDDE